MPCVAGNIKILCSNVYGSSYIRGDGAILRKHIYKTSRVLQ